MTENFKPSYKSKTPRLSKEDYAKMKKEEKDKVYKMLDDTSVEVLSDVGKYQEFLETQSRSNKYSTSNALLIYNQCPNASKLKDFNEWKAEGASVEKGKKGIYILEPYDYVDKDGNNRKSYNTKKVFDVSQTNKKDKAFKSFTKKPVDFAKNLIDSSHLECETVDLIPRSPNSAAFYDVATNKLLVKRGVGDEVKIANDLAKEVAHIELAYKNEEYNRDDYEFKAKSIAYMICKKYGIDTTYIDIEQVPENLSTLEPKKSRNELGLMRLKLNDINNEINMASEKERASKEKDYSR